MINSSEQKNKMKLRQAYADILIELGRLNKDFVTLDADTAGSVFIDQFIEIFPQRHFRIGIAEQNMISIAAGISTLGIIPIVHTMSVFASMRAIEQIRNSVAYPNFNVKIIASHQGLDVGEDGATHEAIEEMAIIRSIPNIVLLSPADAIELKSMVKFMLDYKGPVYLRIGRSPVPYIFPEGYKYKLGFWPTLRNGKDVTIVAVGIMVDVALSAHNLLKKENISSQVINASTFKPINEENIINKMKPTGAVVTIEDHTLKGGLGTLVSEIVAKHYPLPIEMIGLNDCFGESGKPCDLFKKYGLTPENVVSAVKKVIRRKQKV